MCNSDPGCTHAGINCQTDGTAQNCVAQAPGCFKKMGAADVCGQRESCKENMGCTCDNDAACTAGEGTYCGSSSTVFTCDSDADGCIFVTADTTTCTLPQTCGGDPGAADCLCPTADTGTTGSFCSTINSRRCSADGGSVLVCVVDAETQCQIWDNGTFEPNATNPGDNCAADGLTCNNIQCQCPFNNTSDFHVNGHAAVQAKRLLRPELVQNGLKSPAICSYESPSLGLNNALIANGPGHSNKARVIMDHCDDAPPLGTGTCLPIVFSKQTAGLSGGDFFPWHVPRNVEVITDEEPSAGGNGDTLGFHPDNYIVVVQDFSNDDGSGFKAAVNVSDTGRISGFALIEGGCDIDVGDGTPNDPCALKFADWPNVMVQLLDLDGFRFTPFPTRSEAHVEHMHISGAGGPVLDELGDTTAGGDFVFRAATGMVEFTPSDGDIIDNLDDFVNGGEGSAFIAFAGTTSAGNTGAFGPVQVELNEDDDLVLMWYNPLGATEGFGGEFVVSDVGNIDVGLLVGRDELNEHAANDSDIGDPTGPDDPGYGDTNATIDGVFISHFSTILGDCNEDENDGGCDQRIGVLGDDDFPGNPIPAQASQPDRVQFNGGLLLVNNTGMAITDGHYEINNLEIDWSTGQGLEVNDIANVTLKLPGGPPINAETHDNTSVVATNILVHNTQWEPGYFSPVSNSFDSDGDGNGINVTGDGTSAVEDCDDEPCPFIDTLLLVNSESSDNDDDGLAIVTYDPDDGAHVTATGSTFDSNGANGVDIGNESESRDYGAFTTLGSCTITNNGTNGVFVEANADGTIDTGTTTINGGLISANGVDDTFSYSVTKPVPGFADDLQGHGILARANSTVITDSADGDGAGAKLQVTLNGISGATADDGHQIYTNTAFTGNGVTDLCPEGDSGHGYGVGITLLARLTMVNCNVDTNEGAGLVIDDDLDLPGPQAKLPQTVEDDQSNTVEGSTFNGNLGAYECADSSLRPFPVDGVEVTPDGRMFFVEAESTISGNVKNGLDVAGQVPFSPGGSIGANSDMVSDTNGIDGVVVSCQVAIGIGKLPVADSSARVCGFAQLRGGASTDNRANGVRVNGYLFWQEGLVNLNDVDGVVVDHAEVGNPNLPDSYAFGWRNAPPPLFPSAPVPGYRAPIQSKFVDMDVNTNGNNGYTVLAAPFINEQELDELGAPIACVNDPSDAHGLAQGDGFDATRFGQIEPVTNPGGETDIELSTPICDWGMEIRGLAGTINNNGAWGVVIGTDDQEQNAVVKVGDAQIFNNGTAAAGDDGGGIDVHQNLRYGTITCQADLFDKVPGAPPIRCQCDNSGESDLDETVGCTATTILSNNVYSNGGPGLYHRRSFQKALATVDRRTVSSSDFHHNDVTPQDGNVCTVAGGAVEFSSQMDWDGAIGQTDPAGGQGAGPSTLYPADYRCYWGVDDSERNDTLTECNAMNNPNGADSGGVNNHCLWNGTQCRIAWDMGGTPGTGECDSSRNRVFAYVSDPIKPQFTQRGVAAINGAYVLARRNTWGTGGPTNGVFADSASDSRVDSSDDCGSISTCP